MTQPAGGYKVATDLLRTEAKTWDEQASAAENIVRFAESLELGRVEAGLFQVMVGPYNDVVDSVTARCRDAVRNLAATGDTLRAVAATYDAEEESGLHRLQNLY